MEEIVASIFRLQTFPALFTLTLTVAVMLGFGLIVFTRTYRQLYGWYFALTMAGVGIWALGDILLLFGRSPGVVHVGAELFYIAPMIIPVFIWFFALSFPEGKFIKRFPPLIALLAFLPLSILFVFDLDFFVKEIVITDTLNRPIPAMPAFLLYASYFSLFFMLTYIAFLFKMRRLKGLAHTQVTYTFVGALLASVPALITNLSLPMIGRPGVIWLGPLFTLIFAVAVTAAIVKHRLFDIRLYAVRSAAYILSLAAAAVLYVVPAVLLSGYLLDAPLRLNNITLLASITLVVAFLFPWLKRFFDRFTRRWFYRDAYEPQVLIGNLNKALVADLDMERLIYDASQIIISDFKAEFCVFGLKQTEFSKQRIIGTPSKTFALKDIATVRQMTPHFEANVIVTDYLDEANSKLKQVLVRNGIAVLVRLAPRTSPDGEGLGYLVLGQKRSGNPYGTQDVAVLDIISRELFLAIQNVLRFEEIENFNLTLQQKVEDATHKLRRTNEKLRRLDEIKDDFISMASHQLRTPLTSVKGYVSMVLDGDAGRLTPLQRKLLNQSFVSSQRMAYLISDLLNVSRLRTGKFVIDAAPTNLAKVIQDEVDQLQETVKGRNLTLSYTHSERFPTLLVDETKMRQVIMNFIDNAIYYTPGGGHIEVTLSETPKTIQLTVTDNGIGVPRHEQHHLFTKFFRARNAKHARPDGTGLGLFMAKKVIIAQGGAVIFRSQQGKGSTFGFTFPKERLETPKTKPATVPASPQTDDSSAKH